MRGSSHLEILDDERRLSGSSSDGSGLFREWSRDRSECRIVFSDLSPSQLAVRVHDEQVKARDGGYALEWKVYGHDPAAGLEEMLAAAGFEAGDVETVLVLDLDTVDRHRFEGPRYETRTVRDDRGLLDVAAISRQIGRRDVEAESNRLSAMLRAARVPKHSRRLPGGRARLIRSHSLWPLGRRCRTGRRPDGADPSQARALQRRRRYALARSRRARLPVRLRRRSADVRADPHQARLRRADQHPAVHLLTSVYTTDRDNLPLASARIVRARVSR